MRKATNWKEIVIRELIKKDNRICRLCNIALGDELTEIDHIVEKKNGGLDELSNLRLVHMICHKKRHLNFKPIPVVVLAGSLKQNASNQEKQMIITALNECKGNITHTAKSLCLSRKGLQLKMIKYNLRKPTVD